MSLHSAPDPSRAGEHVAIFGRAPGAAAVVLWQRVRALLALSATPAADGAVRLFGAVFPSHAGERVLLERRTGRGWAVFARLVLDRSSAFSVVRLLTPGTPVRALFPGDRRNIRSYSAAIVPSAPPTVTAALGPSRSLPAGFFGVNWDYSGAARFASDLPAEYGALEALDPGTLRWPGETGANYFQWQQGGSGTFDFTLSDLAAAYKATGAPPVFDLNVMTSTLQSQVQMLMEARSLGVPIRYLELGNELYLDLLDYVKAFPTGADYVTGATLVDYWTALQGSENAAYVPSPTGAPALNLAGLALEWVGCAAAGADSSAPIEFGGGPALAPGGKPALVGCRFSSGRDVIVNLSGETETMPAGAAIPSGSAY